MSNKQNYTLSLDSGLKDRVQKELGVLSDWSGFVNSLILKALEEKITLESIKPPGFHPFFDKISEKAYQEMIGSPYLTRVELEYKHKKYPDWTGTDQELLDYLKKKYG